MNVVAGRSTSLKWARGARILWVILFLFSVGLFVYAIPTRYTQLKTLSDNPDTRVGQLTSTDVETLHDMGISPVFYATYFTILETLAGLPFIIVATLIFLRKSDDWVALLVSITGILLGTMAIPVVNSLSGNNPTLAVIIQTMRVTGITMLVITFFVFPNGNFIPGWSRWIALVWVVFGLVTIFLPSIDPPPGIASVQASDIPLVLWYIVWIGIGISFQVYRYLFVSPSLQRQQTKWVVYGYVLVFVLLLAATLPNIIFENLRQPNMLSMQVRFFAVTITLGLTLPILPITVGFSIFRYRLWDIDILIQRTLVYGLLTILLLVVYFSSILALQLLFSAITGQESAVAIVISTLIIAALFNRMRKGVQNFIDRRFYRQKYDAERPLADFAAAARSETDLETLTGSMAEVVQTTLQPDAISVWFLPYGFRRKPQE